MPLIRIELRSGKTKEFKQKLLDIVHLALVDCIKIPEDDRRLRLFEFDKDNFTTGSRSENYTIIEITLFPGRSPNAKRKLYRQIVDKLVSELGYDKNDITIVLYEPPLENWSIRGGYPASDFDLNSKLNV